MIARNQYAHDDGLDRILCGSIELSLNYSRLLFFFSLSSYFDIKSVGEFNSE